MTATRHEATADEVGDDTMTIDEATMTAAGAAPDEPVATLRGAGVRADPRCVGRVLGGLCAVAIVVTAGILLVAGAHQNAQIAQLRTHGVPVTVSVTGCVGLMGGSGSNAAGYACRGTFFFDGRRYNEPLPGNTLYPPGATFRAVTVPGDPALVSTPGAVARERASNRVFIVPVLLLVAPAVLVAAVTAARRRARIAPSRRG
jgi:hypothetical protein